MHPTASGLTATILDKNRPQGQHYTINIATAASCNHLATMEFLDYQAMLSGLKLHITT